MANINSWLTENRLLASRKEVYAIGDNDYNVDQNYGRAVSAIDDQDANVRVRELTLGSLTVEFDDESSKYATGDHTRDEAIAGITQGTIDFNMKLAPGQIYSASADYVLSGTGTYDVPDPTYTAQAIDYTNGNIGLPYKKYLEGAGLKSEYTPTIVDVDAALDVTISQHGFWEFYPTTDKDLETLTMVIQDKASVKDKDSGELYGVQYKIAGAMSTLTIDSESAGKPFKMNYSYTGKVDSVYEVYETSASPLNLLNYEDEYSLSTIANKMLFTYITIHELDHSGVPIGDNAINFCVNTFSLDTGLTISPFQCQMDGSGVKYNAITSRDPRITIDPLLERVGPAGSDVVDGDWFKFWDAINSETTYSMQIRVFDGDPMDLDAPVSNELFAIISPRVQAINSNISDSDGYFRNELTFRPLRNINGTTGSDGVQADYKVRVYAESKVV